MAEVADMVVGAVEPQPVLEIFDAGVEVARPVTAPHLTRPRALSDFSLAFIGFRQERLWNPTPSREHSKESCQEWRLHSMT